MIILGWERNQNEIHLSLAEVGCEVFVVVVVSLNMFDLFSGAIAILWMPNTKTNRING
jgi:hypothetical protein